MPELAFLPDLATLAAFSLAALILTITPGPDMTLFLSRALSEGRAAGFAAMLGAASGIVVHTVLAAVGLSALLAASPKAFLVLKTVGALYLAWLAVEAIRHGSALTLERETGPRRPLVVHWATGLGINLMNPKVILFFVTFLPQFVGPGDPHAAGKLLFLGLYFILLAVPLTGLMILAADRFAGALKRNRRASRLLDYLFATIFGAFALRLLVARGG